MKKIYANLLAIILLVTFVSATTIGLTALTPVVFEKGAGAKALPSSEQITFDCGSEKGVVIEDSEPDGKWDENDLLSAIRKQCSEAVTHIKMNGLEYKQNKYGTKSFDETYLKKDECQRDGNHWYNADCNDISQEEVCTNQAKFWYDDKCNDKEQVFEEPKEII